MPSAPDRPGGIAERIVGVIIIGPCVPPIVDRVDVNDIVERIDVNDVAERIEVDELVERVDVNALLDRTDIDRLLDRTDVVERIVQRVVESEELEDLIANTPNSMLSKVIDTLRSQVVTFDLIVHGFIDRLIGREPRRKLAVGRRARGEGARYVAPDRDIELQGEYAGAVSRLLAWMIDSFAVGGIFALLLGLLTLGIEVVTGRQIEPTDYGIFTAVTFVFLYLIYFALAWTMSGKTIGMAVLGIQVRRRDRSYADGGNAVVRAIVLPLSFLLLGIGLIIGLFQRENRCLHDLIAGTCVVYAWDARRARLRLLTHHGEGRQVDRD